MSADLHEAIENDEHEKVMFVHKRNFFVNLNMQDLHSKFSLNKACDCHDVFLMSLKWEFMREEKSELSGLESPRSTSRDTTKLVAFNVSLQVKELSSKVDLNEKFEASVNPQHAGITPLALACALNKVQMTQVRVRLKVKAKDRIFSLSLSLSDHGLASTLALVSYPPQTQTPLPLTLNMNQGRTRVNPPQMCPPHKCTTQIWHPPRHQKCHPLH